jgi:hypothetical protein
MRLANKGSLEKINAWNHMRGAKGDLLGLGKEVVRAAVQQPTQGFDRHQFLLGDQPSRPECQS